MFKNRFKAYERKKADKLPILGFLSTFFVIFAYRNCENEAEMHNKSVIFLVWVVRNCNCLKSGVKVLST